MTEFRDMQEQGTFHEGRKYEREIQVKRIAELERSLQVAEFKVEGMLAVGKELIKQSFRIKELETKYEDTQQLRQKSAKMIITMVGLKEQIAGLEEQVKEEYSRGIKDGLNQAAEIVKNC